MNLKPLALALICVYVCALLFHRYYSYAEARHLISLYPPAWVCREGVSAAGVYTIFINHNAKKSVHHITIIFSAQKRDKERGVRTHTHTTTSFQRSFSAGSISHQTLGYYHWREDLSC